MKFPNRPRLENHPHRRPVEDSLSVCQRNEFYKESLGNPSLKGKESPVPEESGSVDTITHNLVTRRKSKTQGSSEVGGRLIRADGLVDSILEATEERMSEHKKSGGCN